MMELLYNKYNFTCFSFHETVTIPGREVTGVYLPPGGGRRLVLVPFEIVFSLILIHTWGS